MAHCLESILAQTLRDIEVICIDDGSEDQSAKILNEYALRDARISILHQANRGAAAARNAGLSQAKGTYITFVDADDYIEQDTYLLCTNVFSHTIDLVHFGTQLESESPTTNDAEQRFLDHLNEGTLPMDSESILHLSGCVWNSIFRRTIIESHQLRFPETVIWGEDMCFKYKYLAFCRAVYVIPKRCYHYVRHHASITLSDKTSVRRASDLLNVVDQVCTFYQDANLLAKKKKIIYALIQQINTALQFAPDKQNGLILKRAQILLQQHRITQLFPWDFYLVHIAKGDTTCPRILKYCFRCQPKQMGYYFLGIPLISWHLKHGCCYTKVLGITLLKRPLPC